MLPSQDVIEIRFERLDDSDLDAAFGLCRITRSEHSEGVFTVGRNVLAPATPTTSGYAEVDAKSCIPMPEGMLEDRAMAVPHLALAMLICDSVALELGDLPVCTTGGDNLRMIATVCRWRTGREVLVLDLHDGQGMAGPGHRRIDGIDPQRAIDEISRASATVPGVASIVLSRKSEAVDILLEAMPTWGRVMIASPASEPATIDFYNNVHRKGVSLVAGPTSSAFLFEFGMIDNLRPLTERAIRILQRADLADALCTSQV